MAEYKNLPVANIAMTYVANLGLRHQAELAEICGGAEAYFAATEGELRELGLAEGLVRGREVAYNQGLFAARLCHERGVRVLVRGAEDYPRALAQCADAPAVIYCRGELDFSNIKMLAVVGTRRITAEGDALCRRLVGDLLDGVDDLVIVSGLALGVDGVAHRATVDKGRATVAVLPGWVDDITPTSHFGLARDILAKGGAIVSEQPPGSGIIPKSFVIRNRIVAGLASGTLVVQSAVKGGSMITAEMTLGYDRELFTVAGDGGEDFAGNRKLIKGSQAQLIDAAGEIAEILGWKFARVHSGVEGQLDSMPEELLGLYSALPDSASVTIDQVAELLDMSLGEVSAMLMRLEIGGFIRTTKGRQIRKI